MLTRRDLLSGSAAALAPPTPLARISASSQLPPLPDASMPDHEIIASLMAWSGGPLDVICDLLYGLKMTVESGELDIGQDASDRLNGRIEGMLDTIVRRRGLPSETAAHRRKIERAIGHHGY